MAAGPPGAVPARQRIEHGLRRYRRIAGLGHRAIDGADDLRIMNGLVDIDAVGAQCGDIGEAFAKLLDA